jgi:lipopolysaccharide transport system permease protein
MSGPYSWQRTPTPVTTITTQPETSTVEAQAPAPPLRVPRPTPRIDLHGETTSPFRLWRQVRGARELLVILARKEFHVRYRRASFGVLWALGLPLIQALVMAIVFSHVTRIQHAPHYAIFVLSGMAAWVFFSMALGAGSTAIVDGTELSSRVYFPRALLPLVQIGTSLYSYVVTLAILVLLCPILGVGLGTDTLVLVPASVLLIAMTTGFCLVNAALHVYFRDIRYMVSAALIVWMYVTPVIYPSNDAPGKLRLLIDINPMTGVIDLFHAATVGRVGPMMFALVVSVVWTIGLLVVGIALHCRFDRVFADLL